MEMEVLPFSALFPNTARHIQHMNMNSHEKATLRNLTVPLSTRSAE
jgi:hypothetical protein